ncbi:TetR family transcriptional regulator [Rhodococcus sp. NPDC003318]|uniref:TetR/AcrR family transcriptional regulator n=1 Tax=Rhodococcus sp. NPDC003318 TaxID=3364503 RepID=UPI00369A3B33
MAQSSRVPYQQATRTLLRESVLGAMRDLLAGKDWSDITMTEVATEAGVSRQTVYNEFKSRQGLAEAYALSLADTFVSAVDDAVYSNVGRPREALVDGFTTFFRRAAADPLVQSLLTGDVKPDLLRLITTGSAPLIDRAATRLADTFTRSWVQASDEDAAILGRGIARLAISYVSMPPESDRDVAEDLARVFSPFVEAITAAGTAQVTTRYP